MVTFTKQNSQTLQETCIEVILDCNQLETIIKDFVTSQIMSDIITKQIFKKRQKKQPEMLLIV